MPGACCISDVAVAAHGASSPSLFPVATEGRAAGVACCDELFEKRAKIRQAGAEAAAGGQANLKRKHLYKTRFNSLFWVIK